MTLIDKIRKLCTPAYVYLVISVIAVVMMMFQNAGNQNKYCVGDYECQVYNTASIFIGHGIYIVIWTIILNALCKSGFKQLSWFLVLLPFILFFIFIGLFMISSN